jgi:hypothetical protein
VRPGLLLAYCIIWLASLPGSAHPGAARAVVIDDSGTLPYSATLAMHWREISPRNRASTEMVGALDLRVRLNVSPWLRHRGHIYMVLPAQQPGAISAAWTTNGRLLPGQLSAGGRALVYSGPITAAFIEDMVHLTVTVDGRRMVQSYPVSFRFEMEED